MLKIKNQDVYYKVVSCIFAVIIVVFMLIGRNIIDLIYLSVIFMFILSYFVEIKWK